MKIIYTGLFLTKESEELLAAKGGLLAKQVKNMHVTFKFTPEESLPNAIVGMSFLINVVGEGKDKNNYVFW